MLKLLAVQRYLDKGKAFFSIKFGKCPSVCIGQNRIKIVANLKVHSLKQCLVLKRLVVYKINRSDNVSGTVFDGRLCQLVIRPPVVGCTAREHA